MVIVGTVILAAPGSCGAPCRPAQPSSHGSAVNCYGGPRRQQVQVAVTVPTFRFVASAFRVRPRLYIAVLALVAYVLAAPASAHGADSDFRSAEVTATRFFEPLEHNVVDVAGEFAEGPPYTADFLANFTATGGIERWGYPTSAVFEESPGRLTQYYQRGVVDWQPPPGGGAHSFQRRLAWDYLGGGLGGSTDLGVELHLTNPNPGDLLGPWGHKVANTSVEGVPIGFAAFFHRLGGIASFGFPKTDARRDTHPQAELHTPGRPVDGRIRQYFQSAVLEYHPESPGAPVKLSLLGDTLRDHRYPGRAWRHYLAFGPEAPLAVGDQLNLGPARRGPQGASVEAVAEFLELSLLRVETDRACGSGFFVTDDGYALTTWTLASDAQSITVESPRGYSAPARLVAGDVAFDLALIKIDGDGHFPVVWDDAGSAAVGDDLVTHGYRSTSILNGRATACQAWPTAELRSYTHVASHQRSDFRPPIDVGNSGGPAALRSGQVAGLIAGGTPERPSAEAFVPAVEIQPRISAWIADLDRGQAATRPPQQSYERTVLAQLDALVCPAGATDRGVWDWPLAVQVQGREIELTATVFLNDNAFSAAFIEFGDGFYNLVFRNDLIILGEYYDYESYSTLRWQRGHIYSPDIFRDEIHGDLKRGAEFDVKFVYNGGAVALFVNGNTVHQDTGYPYLDDISIGIGCIDPDYYEDTPEIHLTDILITGRPSPTI